MRVTAVDPRDEAWEADGPAYRVHFWSADQSCEECEPAQADVDEVLAWADEHAAGRTMSIWLVHRDDRGLGLLRLAGIDPTAPAGVWPSWVATRRRRGTGDALPPAPG